MARYSGLLIFQTTTFCNIDCSYCYLGGRDKRVDISADVVRAACLRASEHGLVGDSISVVWHAGEPLVVGPEKLASLIEACEPLRNSTGKIQQCVQTNGTLINDAFCDVFEKYNVRIGISLDGPKHLHDAFRVDRRGRGTFEKAMRGAAELSRRSIPFDPFDVICVLSERSLSCPDEIYEFFAAMKVRSVGFNVDEIEAHNKSSSMTADGYLNKIALFWETLAKIHFQRRAFYLREFDDLLYGVRDGQLNGRSNLATPLAILTVGTDGSLSTFSPELLGADDLEYGGFIIGNVLENSIQDGMNSPKFARIAKDIQFGVDKCESECAYFSVCGGGAPSNKLAENGTFASSVTLHCKATKQLLVDALLKVTDEMRPAA